MIDPSILAARFLSPRLTPRYVSLDRIHVRGLILECNIGAFSEEHGVTQRVAFDVELSLFPTPRVPTDTLESVLSYDIIVDGIREIVAAGHITLVETLTERIAAHCLVHRRVAKAVITAEKLDRVPGARLGVTIERFQSAAYNGNITPLPTTR